MLNVGFMKKYISSGIWEEGGYSVLVNYQALQLKYRSISPPPQSLFYIKYRRYGLLLVSFIEPVALLQGNTIFPSPPLASRPKCRIKKIPRF